MNAVKCSPFDDHPAAVLVLLRQHVAVEAVPVVLFCVFPGRLQFLGGSRGDEGEAVDLAVRMVQRHPDSLALVLEDKDVRDLFAGAELLVTVGPYLDEVRYAALAQAG